jgi:hypothetical protein
MNSSHEDFLNFLKRGLDGKEANGAAISALLDAYVRLGAAPQVVPDRAETLDYAQPWQVYLIRNVATGKSYVGRAAKGFLQRYPEGAWWLSHNDTLALDVLLVGVHAFRVQVFQCVDSEDMCRLESRMYDDLGTRGALYNKVRPSGDVPLPFVPLTTVTESSREQSLTPSVPDV